MIKLKEIAEELNISERKARRILREESQKTNHKYYWVFTPKEKRQIVSTLKKHLQ